MKAAMVAKWTTPVPGREKAAFAYGREVDDFFGKKAAEGLCTEPKWFWAPTGESLCPSQAVTPAGPASAFRLELTEPGLPESSHRRGRRRRRFGHGTARYRDSTAGPGAHTRRNFSTSA